MRRGARTLSQCRGGKSTVHIPGVSSSSGTLPKMPRSFFVVLKAFGWVLLLMGTYFATAEVAFSYYTPSGGSYCHRPSEIQVVPNIISRIGCSFMCSQYQGEGFMFTEGKCTIAGGLKARSIGEKLTTFRRVTYSSNSTNIALGKPTNSVAVWLSPTPMVSGMAVDGIESTVNYFHSEPKIVKPWWYVDLGGNRVVTEVHIMPYGSGHSIFFTTVEIRVGKALPAVSGDFSSWDLFSYFQGPPPAVQEYQKFSTNSSYPLCGRYVSIQKLGTAPYPYFVFNEVKVFALEELLGI
ncbi:uncharacterized protein LOC135199781 [Macrobrachium nipponense]|uniref:uncharacterized protein LOC135199781 n=1 Tax=Macrobrachium nipponense TaxID=159736 RepID=UPI0030C847F4